MASAAATRISSHVRSLVRDREGSVAIVFALTSFVVLSMVGGAIDYGRAVTARDQMQNAVDAATLAAARVWQTEKDLALAEEKALLYFQRNKPRAATSAVTGFTADLAANTITLEATATVPTPFIAASVGMGRMIGVKFDVENFSLYARSQAQLAVGGNAEQNLEISLMLDVTGSMGGQKLSDLKDAAKDLIDIVVWDDQSHYSSRVALAPFSERVNAGPYASAMTGLPATRQVTKTSGKGKNKTTTTTTQYLVTCTTDRWGVAQHRDDAPAATPDTFVGPYQPGNGNSPNVDDQYASSPDCPRPSAEIMPLSRDKAALKARIDSFVADGYTAGALGTETAWYLISPKWAGIWPAESRPAEYGAEKTQKIAVLMTDGEYNYYRGQYWSSAAVSAFAKNTCRTMKEAGVTVYTIGFQLDSSRARDVLADCATDASKFYDAEDGAALRQAFRDIALQIAKLRLSQ
jgi:Flp pilus assembly protein TadG